MSAPVPENAPEGESLLYLLSCCGTFTCRKQCRLSWDAKRVCGEDGSMSGLSQPDGVRLGATQGSGSRYDGTCTIIRRHTRALPYWTLTNVLIITYRGGCVDCG